jgi:ATP-dependent RNA helicase RhlE
MNFKELGLNKHIQKAIEESHYITPTPVQSEVIPQVLNKKDVVVTAQTGTGKTAAFALPILQSLYDKQLASKKGKKLRALILTPTRELALQVEKNIEQYSKYTILKTAVIYGGVSIEPQEKILKKGVDILIATPGRLLDLIKQEIVALDYVETFVLDEADLMLNMGFIDDVLKIHGLTPSDRQTLLFSATIPDKIKELAKTIAKEPVNVSITPTVLTAQNVKQHLYYTPIAKKMQLVLYLLRNDIKGNIIIFRRTKYGVDKLEKLLAENNYKVESLHGAKSQLARQDSLKRFENGEVNILIATDVASRGIDIEDVDVIINFDIPNLPETYVHRVGRTGRAGKNGVAYSFCCAVEKEFIPLIQEYTREIIPVIEEHPFLMDHDAKPQVHRKKSGSKYRKGRKSEASKKKKKRWY